jgi:hypothetical protein
VRIGAVDQKYRLQKICIVLPAQGMGQFKHEKGGEKKYGFTSDFVLKAYNEK